MCLLQLCLSLMSDGGRLILVPTTRRYSLPNTAVLTIKLSIADASLLRE